ncbi:DUF7344 domain-containing protein [Natronoglomus mannanivorans]|uniref:DUF7344 domain-containing protein n=1 Tax=Natronoglomus mannanivorans TaxID=2979990 RepID=A0AAP2Z1C3_9EURY|nr:hypothetical protein [Halobacteria archaeon AArc-xg1-1]
MARPVRCKQIPKYTTPRSRPDAYAHKPEYHYHSGNIASGVSGTACCPTEGIPRLKSWVDVKEVSEEVFAEIRLSLYHEHIPKLESEEIIEYDPERQHVVPTERFDQLRPSLSAIIEVDPDLQVPVEL